MSDCFKIGAEVLGNNKRRQGWKGIVTDIFTNGKTKKRIKYTVRWKNGQSTDEYSQSLSLPELDSVGRPRRVYDSEMLEEAELLTSAASIPIHLPVPSTTSEGTTRTGRATASNNDIGGDGESPIKKRRAIDVLEPSSSVYFGGTEVQLPKLGQLRELKAYVKLLPTQRAQRHCRICKRKCTSYCTLCTNEDENYIYCCCNPSKGTTCFQLHLVEHLELGGNSRK